MTNLLEPVLTVDKEADAYEYEVGDVVSYRVAYLQTVENAQARQTIVSDNLPEFLELLPESVSGNWNQGPSAHRNERQRVVPRL